MTVRMRHTRSHTNNRRAHHKIAKSALSKDTSGNLHVRHRLTSETGTYRGRQVLNTSAKIEKIANRRQGGAGKTKSNLPAGKAGDTAK